MKRILSLATLLALLLTSVCFTGATAEEKVTLRMAIMTGMQEYYALAEQYMADNPNITIEIEEYPSAEYNTLIKAKLAGGDCWDVFAASTTIQPSLAAGGHVEDLSDLTDVIARYRSPESVVSTRTLSGVLGALPAQFQYTLLFYNRTMLKELGLEVPTNWDELLNMVRVAKESGVTPIASGFKENWVVLHLLTCIASNTVQMYDLDWGVKRHNNEVTFADSEGWRRAIDKYRTLINEGAFSASAVSTSDDQAMMSFLNGGALCYYSGTWGLSSILAAKPDGFDFGAMRVAVNDPGEEVCTAESTQGDFCVWSKGAHKAEAKKWLAYTLSAEQNLAFNTNKGPSPFADVNVPLHDSLQEFEKLVAESGGKTSEWFLFQQRWPEGMPYPEPIIYLLQELFYPELARDTVDLLGELDKAWDEVVSY